MVWNEDSVNKLVLKYHSNKNVIETVLYLLGHDDASVKLLNVLRYAIVICDDYEY